MASMRDSLASAETVMAVLEASAGRDYIGEPVSQLDHALQTAACARRAGAGEAELIAALLHDVGHLCDPAAPRMADVGVLRHEELGADYLAGLGFAHAVCELVRGHVAAKRYLVATRPGYAARLSAASRATLRHQGGPMSPEACARFRADGLHVAKLRLRAWDEEAKVPGLRVDGLDAYRPLLRAHLEAVFVEGAGSKAAGAARSPSR